MLFRSKVWSMFCALLSVWLLAFFATPLLYSASAQTNANLPVAITVPLPEASTTGGQVIIFDGSLQRYALSRSIDEPNVYGVTVANPPLLFASASNTIPVLTSGSVYVRFTTAAGSIARGDALVASSEIGVAQKAAEDHVHVFAIALEDSNSSNNGQILVHFDPVLAKVKHAENIERAEQLNAEGVAGVSGSEVGEESTEEPSIVEQLFEKYARGVVASLIAIGALFFVMYTFRTTMVNATQSVGRNPRARNAIMTVSIGNIIFAIIICLLAIFVALAILVLPV